MDGAGGTTLLARRVPLPEPPEFPVPADEAIPVPEPLSEGGGGITFDPPRVGF
jgi:hypothetical protein